jgi:hypothetical protein
MGMKGNLNAAILTTDHASPWIGGRNSLVATYDGENSGPYSNCPIPTFFPLSRALFPHRSAVDCGRRDPQRLAAPLPQGDPVSWGRCQEPRLYGLRRHVLSITHKFWIALVSIPRGLRRVGCAENQVGFRSNSARHSPRWCGLSALSVCGVRKPGVVTPGWNGAGPVAR